MEKVLSSYPVFRGNVLHEPYVAVLPTEHCTSFKLDHTVLEVLIDFFFFFVSF